MSLEKKVKNQDTRASKKNRTVWECICDPSGDFLGSKFRLVDVRAGGFEEGTRFRNTDTGEEITSLPF